MTVPSAAKYDAFLRKYIDAFKYKTLDSEQWRVFVETHFAAEIGAGALKDWDWRAWFHAPGMPPHQPQCVASIARRVKLVNRTFHPGST